MPILAALVLITTAITISTSVGIIAAGHRGVVLKFGAVTGKVLGEGLYFVTPAVERVIEMSVQVQAYKAKASSASRDLQEVTTEITLNYSLTPSSVTTLYQTVGLDWEHRLIDPAVQEAVKASTAGFDAEKLIVDRPKVRADIEKILRDRIEVMGLHVMAVSITDFSFSKEFDQAVEAKVKAQQDALTAKHKLEQVKMEAEQDLARKRAESEGLRLQKEQVTDRMIELRKVEVQLKALDVQMEAMKKWNGAFPATIVGSSPGNLPILSLFGLGDKK
jgi:regulator of protease activity HflC (stomatin/prohibitin superfamily)